MTPPKQAAILADTQTLLVEYDRQRRRPTWDSNINAIFVDNWTLTLMKTLNINKAAVLKLNIRDPAVLRDLVRVLADAQEGDL